MTDPDEPTSITDRWDDTEVEVVAPPEQPPRGEPLEPPSR